MGSLEEVRAALGRDLQVGDIVDYSGDPTLATIVPGVRPAWHVIETHPNRERTTAAYLVARRFGVFLPEKDETVVRRGRALNQTALMFRGYVFVFVWGMNQHFARIQAVPGFARLLTIDGPDGRKRPAILSDEHIDKIRAVENTQRPLHALMVDVAQPKRRWTKKQKMIYQLQREQAERDMEVVACRPWSPFEQDLMDLDSEGRNQTLRKALGLAA